MTSETTTIALDGDNHADADLILELTFKITSAEWVEPDHLPTLGFWHGAAKLVKAEVLGVEMPLDKVVKHLGQAWVASLQRDAFDQWAEDQPSPHQERLQDRADRQKDEGL